MKAEKPPVRHGRVWAAPPVPLGESTRVRARQLRQAGKAVSPRSVPDGRPELPSAARALAPAAVGATQAARTGLWGEPSPTMSIRATLKILGCALLLGLILGARGVVHSAHGMPDGLERDVTLRVGNAALWVSQVTGLDLPWKGMQAALGRSDQPSTPPLLASSGPGTGSGGNRRPPATKTPPSRRGQPRKHPKPVVHALRKPTPAHPLNLLITGDSQTEFVGPDLVDDLSHSGVVNGSVDTHYGTGLARPDYVDWSVVARQQLSSYHPEAIVVFMGGNDNQGMTLADGTVLPAGSPGWVREYERRAEICMRIWAGNGTRRVYWLSVPPARDPGWAADNALMNQALRQAASRVPGAEYLDILGPITNHGQYSDYVNVNGQPTLVRTEDGFHLTGDGSTLVAGEVLRVIDREWHIKG